MTVHSSNAIYVPARSSFMGFIFFQFQYLRVSLADDISNETFHLTLQMTFNWRANFVRI